MIEAVQAEEEYQDTEIGILSKDWRVNKIGDIFDIQQGKQLSAKESQAGKIKRHFLRTANIFWDSVDLSSVDNMYFTDKEFEKLKLKVNDILVCEGGDVGRTALWRGELADCLYQNHLYRLRPKIHNYDPLFFVLWMRFAILRKHMYVHSANRTTIPNISSSRLKEFVIPLPPLLEQQNIAYVLSIIQNAQQSSERVINSLKELKKSLMKHLFTYGAVSFEDAGKVKLRETETGMIPVYWRESKVKNCSKQILTGGTPKTEIKEYYTPKEIPWMKSGEVQGWRIRRIDTYISKKGLENSNARMLPKNSVVIALAGRGKTRGTTAILDVECACNQSVVCMVPNDEVSTEYLHYYLSNLYKYIRNLTGDEDRTGLNKEIIGNLPLCLPDMPEQHQIASILTSVDDKIEAEKQKKMALNELFNSMLKNLMTAKIRVNNLVIQNG